MPGVVRRFGERVAVDDVTFTIGPGETYGLLGPNGAGKTTTIRLICGLLHKDAGAVTVSGEDVEDRSTPIRVTVVTVDGTSDVLPEGFSYSAPTMLVPFVFINALAAGSAMIQSRDLGIYQRMLAGPVTAGSVVLGETLVYATLALVRSLLIVGVGTLVFGVSWGDPLAAAVLLVAWSAVATGAGMLSGTLFRTPEQGSSIGPAAGIAFGMLGGCMWPLEIVPSGMRAVGHATPHAWAVDAWTTLLSRGGSLADIEPQLLVLAGFAAGMLVLASVRLRRRLTA